MPVSINGNTGVVTGLAVGGLPDGRVDADSLASNAVTAGKLASGVGGKILQVVATNVTASSSVSLSSHSTLYDTPLTVNITSTAANSKFLVSGLISGEGSQPDHDYGFVIRRTIGGSGTSISIGDSGAGIQITRGQNQGYFDNNNDSTSSSSSIPPYLDSPSQAAGTVINYSFKVIEIGTNDSTTYYFNRCVNASSGGGYERASSYITVIEVAA